MGDTDTVQVDSVGMRAVADRLDGVEIDGIDGTPNGEGVFGYRILVAAVDYFVGVVDPELAHQRNRVVGMVDGLREAAGHYDDTELTAIELIAEIARWSQL